MKTMIIKRPLLRILKHRQPNNGQCSSDAVKSLSFLLSERRQPTASEKNGQNERRFGSLSSLSSMMRSHRRLLVARQEMHLTTFSSSSSNQGLQQQQRRRRRAEEGSWNSLSPSEQAAWKVLDYDQECWESSSPPPRWKEWNELSLDERSAAKYGLNVSSEEDWDDLAPVSSSPWIRRRQSTKQGADEHISSSMTDIPSLSSLLKEEEDSRSSTKPNSTGRSDGDSHALVVAQETRLARQQQKSIGGGLGGSIGKAAYQTVKGLAPVVGPLMRGAGTMSRGGRGAAGLAVAGSLLESLPTIVDSMSGVLEVTGVDTVIYLDDSGSMQGSNLYEGQRALSSLESRLKREEDDQSDQRFLPTRIVKFGEHPTVLNPSEEDWNCALVNAAWDGSSGGTYMWKMIQDDIRTRYKPAGGKLRVVVITDGYDVLSPPPYQGARGFDPLMRTLLKDGFDIEWSIIVVGNETDNIFLGQQELSSRDKQLYKNLCGATGGQFLSLDSSSSAGGSWDADKPEISNFLDSIEDSGYYDSESDRRERQKQYKLEAKKGKAEKFDWLPQLPDGSKKK